MPPPVSCGYQRPVGSVPPSGVHRNKLNVSSCSHALAGSLPPSFSLHPSRSIFHIAPSGPMPPLPMEPLSYSSAYCDAVSPYCLRQRKDYIMQIRKDGLKMFLMRTFMGTDSNEKNHRMY